MAADCPDSPIERCTAGASRTTSYTSTTARLPSGGSRVVKIGTAVVLPAPLGPSTPSTVPRGTDRSMPRSAWTSPNDLVRPSTRIAGRPSAMFPPEHPRATDLTVNVTKRANRPHRQRFLKFLCRTERGACGRISGMLPVADLHLHIEGTLEPEL